MLYFYISSHTEIYSRYITEWLQTIINRMDKTSFFSRKQCECVYEHASNFVFIFVRRFFFIQFCIYSIATPEQKLNMAKEKNSSFSEYFYEA